MEKRVTGIYFIVLIIGIIYAIYAAAAFGNKIDNGTAEKEVAIWDDRMETTQEGGVYVYRHVLPAEDISEKVIVYNTVHMYLEVYIGGEKVYELKAGEGSAVRTTGFCWNTITLTEDDAGKEIEFRVTPVYSDSKPKGSFFYGTYREIEHKVLAERIFRLLLSCVIALAGIIMLLYGFLWSRAVWPPRPLYSLPYLPQCWASGLPWRRRYWIGCSRAVW